MDTLNGVIAALGDLGLMAWFLLVLGVVVGMIVGVLPGLTFVMGVLLILPFTYGMGTETGILLMLAVYVAGTYGGAITAILLHIPGEPNNVPLLWDGYTMTRQGRAAEALGWAAISAFAGGMVAWLVVTFAAEPAARLALKLGQPEYFLIVVVGLASVLVLSQGSMLRALVAMLTGMALATVGVDAIYGQVRFDMGTTVLRDGVDYLPVMVGLYALGHVIARYAESFADEGDGEGHTKTRSTRSVLPGLRQLRERSGSLGRGLATGSLMGVVPGAGATVASFVSYGLEKQFGKDRAQVGKGSPNGVVGPQAASTATVGGAFVPLLVLGIPGSAAAAVILGALQLHNIQPGPQIFESQSDLIYTIMAGLLISTVLMTVVGLLAAKPMVRMLDAPEQYVAAVIVLFAFIGAFAVRNSMSDVWVMAGAAILGFFMQRRGYPLAPLVLGAILGPLAERFYVTAMIGSGNDPSIFVTRPISLVLVVVLALMALAVVYNRVRRRSRSAAPHDPASRKES